MARPKKFRRDEHVERLEMLLPFLISDKPPDKFNSLVDQTMQWFFDDLTCREMRDLWVRVTELERLHIATAWGFLERSRPHCMPIKTLYEYLKSCGVPQKLMEEAERLQIAFRPLPSNVIYADDTN